MFSSKNSKQTDSTKNETKPAVKKGGGIPSIISADMSILGNIISDGVVDIDGHIEGNVKCHSVTVRKNGFIKGDVIAESVHVYGRIEGLIKARSVQFFKACRVEGVIMHESITIEDGAFVDGRFKRTDRLVLDERETEEENEAVPEPAANTKDEDSNPSPEPLAKDETPVADNAAPRFETLLAQDDDDADDEEEAASKSGKPKRRARMLDNLRLISDGN